MLARRLRAAEGEGSSRGCEASSSIVSSFHCCSCGYAQWAEHVSSYVMSNLAAA